MSPDAPSIIQQIIAPATLIPACGLLLLSSTSRMNTLLARIRAFHAERLDVWQRDAKPATRDHAVRALRLEGLEHQTNRLLRRVRLLRANMLLLVVAIACNLLSVIGLALHNALGERMLTIYAASAGVFILGIVVMLAAMLASFFEILPIAETVRYEHDRVEALCAQPPPSDANAPPPPLTPDADEGAGL